MDMLCMCGSAATILRMFNIIIIAVNQNDNAILLIAVCMGHFGANDANTICYSHKNKKRKNMS